MKVMQPDAHVTVDAPRLDKLFARLLTARQVGGSLAWVSGMGLWLGVALCSSLPCMIDELSAWRDVGCVALWLCVLTSFLNLTVCAMLFSIRLFCSAGSVSVCKCIHYEFGR